MLTAIGNVEVYLAAEPIDLRKGFAGLSAVVRQSFGQEPMSGHLFVFINRRNQVQFLAGADDLGTVQDGAHGFR